ncbi:unnamed protein product [Rotaria magnacalcarata]|uniref:Uncharacterized protein n=3 Tax=Rotaria magnacalcarata TaxID=392030 RepID=A0A815H5V1_9BILA|nr:unnamed protein product [Rotaria magnacalcarata]
MPYKKRAGVLVHHMLIVRDLVPSQRILKVVSSWTQRKPAQIVSGQIMCNSHWASVILKEGDKMCQRCYEALSYVLDDSFDLEAMDIAFEDEMEKIDLPCDEESILAKQSAPEELNAVFHFCLLAEV